MVQRVAFLRAVNVGRRRVSMARLTTICEDLGYTDVATYANSGNALFEAAGRRGAIETAMERALDAAFGFEVTTFVRTAAELAHVVAADPFPVADGDTYFVNFLKDPPPAAVARALEAASNDNDTLVVIGRDVHWRMRGTSMDTTLTAATWKPLGPHGSTSRNVNLLRKVVAKLER